MQRRPHRPPRGPLVRLVAGAALAALVAPLGPGVAAAGAGAGVPADLQLELLTADLTSPVAVRHAGDGSGRLFVVEQAGTIRIWDGTEILETPFLDLTGSVSAGGERGLLGLAFHPQYASNGYFYVNYTRGAAPGTTVVERYRVSAGDPDLADPASATSVLEVAQPDSNHNGGDLAFGPDGYLYVGLGDGGGSCDPGERAQDLGTLLGKMLRLDVDAAPPGEPNDLCGEVVGYGIPADNPFAGGAGDCDEIWAYGLRNPWRFSFDRWSGDLIIGDVGQFTREEIDLQPAASPGGEDYGWPCLEGDGASTCAGKTCGAGPVAPVVSLHRSEIVGLFAAIVGGYRYRGSGIVGLQGTYLLADSQSGQLWAAVEGAGSWSVTEWDDTTLHVSSFGEDEDGEVHLVDVVGGGLYRLVSPSSIFTDGFETGDGTVWTVEVP